jgi:hypothetical protein
MNMESNSECECKEEFDNFKNIPGNIRVPMECSKCGSEYFVNASTSRDFIEGFCKSRGSRVTWAP